MIDTSLSYSSIPHNYIHCTATTCPQKSECIRWKAYELLPANWSRSIQIINPKSVPPASEALCPHFRKMELLRFAKGMKRILDSVPYSQVMGLKRQMQNYFGRSTYYRCVRGERLVSPQEQKTVGEMFASRGLPNELLFDEYVEQYNFT